MFHLHLEQLSPKQKWHECLAKGFLRKANFFKKENKTQVSFVQSWKLKLDRPVKYMKNKSTILLKTWPGDSDIHKPETIIQLETFRLDDSEVCTMDHTKWSISETLSNNLTE